MVETNSDDYNGLEKRKHTRYKCNMDVVSEIRKTIVSKGRNRKPVYVPGSLKQRTKVLDLSSSGARVEMEKLVKADSPLMAYIETPYGKSIECKAVLSWIKQSKDTRLYTAGIEFKKVKWLQRFRLNRFIKWLSVYGEAVAGS